MATTAGERGGSSLQAEQDARHRALSLVKDRPACLGGEYIKGTFALPSRARQDTVLEVVQVDRFVQAKFLKSPVERCVACGEMLHM